jgi:hypothetical protein
VTQSWLWSSATAVMALALAGGVRAQAQSRPGANGQQRATVKVTGCLQQPGSMAAASGSVGTSGVAARSTTGTPATSTAGFVLLNARAGIGAGGNIAPGTTTGTSSDGSPASASSTGAESVTGRSALTPGPEAAGASGNAGGAMYYLDGQSSELRDHVGHQVEVTGFLASGSGPVSRSGESEGSGSATALGSSPPATPSAASTGQGTATTSGANTDGLLAGGATAPGRDASAASPAAGAENAESSKGTMAGARLAVQSVRMIAPNCSSR